MNVTALVRAELIRQMFTAMTDSNMTNVSVRLYQNDIIADPNRPASDYEEADFHGYSPAISSPDGVADLHLGGVDRAMTGVFYQCNAAPDEAQQIYGWYVSGPNDTTLAAGRFQEPVSVSQLNDYVAFTPILTLQFAEF